MPTIENAERPKFHAMTTGVSRTALRSRMKRLRKNIIRMYSTQAVSGICARDGETSAPKGGTTPLNATCIGAVTPPLPPRAPLDASVRACQFSDVQRVQTKPLNTSGSDSGELRRGWRANEPHEERGTTGGGRRKRLPCAACSVYSLAGGSVLSGHKLVALGWYARVQLGA